MKHVTIADCFHSKSGFGTLSTVEEIDLIDEELVLTEVINGDKYLNIDEDVPCFDESNSNCDDDIIHGIKSKRACIQDDEDDVIGQPMVSRALVRDSILKLQRYFIEQGFCDPAQKALDSCAEVIFSRILTSKKQSSIVYYFS